MKICLFSAGSCSAQILVTKNMKSSVSNDLFAIIAQDVKLTLCSKLTSAGKINWLSEASGIFGHTKLVIWRPVFFIQLNCWVYYITRIVKLKITRLTSYMDDVATKYLITDEVFAKHLKIMRKYNPTLFRCSNSKFLVQLTIRKRTFL